MLSSESTATDESVKVSISPSKGSVNSEKFKNRK